MRSSSIQVWRPCGVTLRSTDSQDATVMSSAGGCPDPSQRLPSALCEGHGLRQQVLDRVPHRAVITSGPVPLENRIRLVTCESSRYQAAREYSLIRPPRTGLGGSVRASNFTQCFDAVFRAAGTKILLTADRAPRMNATCERLIGTLRRELLDRVLILSEAHLRAILIEYQVHYNTARPHQGIAQRVPSCDHESSRVTATNLNAERINRKPVLSGLINEYSRAA
jgi:hypothetical protein